MDLSLNFNNIDFVEHSCFLGVEVPGELKVEKLMKRKDKFNLETPIELFRSCMISQSKEHLNLKEAYSSHDHFQQWVELIEDSSIFQKQPALRLDLFKGVFPMIFNEIYASIRSKTDQLDLFNSHFGNKVLTSLP